MGKDVYRGRPTAETYAEHLVWADGQPLTVSCMFCGWRYVGLAADAKAKAADHRNLKHPEARRRKTLRRGSILNPKSRPDPEVIDENNRVRRERDALILRGGRVFVFDEEAESA